MSERETHFQNFALLVARELYDNGLLDLNHAEAWDAEGLILDILRTRAYDLLIHDRLHTATIDLIHAGSVSEAETYVDAVPDITTWPSTQE